MSVGIPNCFKRHPLNGYRGLRGLLFTRRLITQEHWWAKEATISYPWVVLFHIAHSWDYFGICQGWNPFSPSSDHHYFQTFTKIKLICSSPVELWLLYDSMSSMHFHKAKKFTVLQGALSQKMCEQVHRGEWKSKFLPPTRYGFFNMKYGTPVEPWRFFNRKYIS